MGSYNCYSSVILYCVNIIYGTWRSSVAHLHGVQGVAGSNPVVPTIQNRIYDFVHEGKRYRRSCRTIDKKLAQQIEIRVKNDLIKEGIGIPIDKNKYLLFQTAWEHYFKNISLSPKTMEVKATASKHFLPVFGKKRLADITNGDIEKYQIDRKVETQNVYCKPKFPIIAK